jgi:DNA-binding transcriptional LysR family regulator
MELRQLRYFCAVAEEMHVTRAAERLRLAQPALTQQIKALEAELQTPLLRRVGRGIELTQAGVTFWTQAKDILERVRTTALMTQEMGRGLTGRLAIGLTETASFAPPVTKLLRRTRERWPNVKFVLIQARTHDLFTALSERRIDVAFGRSPPPMEPALAWCPFLTERLVIVVPKMHPLASRRTVDLADLADEDLLLPRGRITNDAFRSQLIAAIGKAGKPARIVQETPEYVMAINLVAAGFGLTIVPESLGGLVRTDVIYRPLRSTPPVRTELLLLFRRGEHSPTALNFIALATQNPPPDSPTRRKTKSL